MRSHVWTLLLSIVSAVPLAGQPVVIDDHVELRANLLGNGRNIMRTVEGNLVGAFVRTEETGSALYFTASSTGGKTWYKTRTPHLGKNDPGLSNPTSPAIDSNFNAAYIAYVSQSPSGGQGYVVSTPNPFAPNVEFRSEGPLTPPGITVKHSFVAASRSGWGTPDPQANSVVYGWVDAAQGAFYVGVSPDGLFFPPARAVHVDQFAMTGPAVSIKGQYVFLMYESQNPAHRPIGVNGAGRSYQVWMESWDGGANWTPPQPLFGRNIGDYPTLQATRTDGGGSSTVGQVALAGGSSGTDDFSQPIVWGPDESGNRLVFVMSTQTPLNSPGSPFPPDYWSDPTNAVGIVSFKHLTGGSAPWVHVVTNKPLASVEPPAGTRVVNRGALHQYSALPFTPVRAVTYVESKGSNPNDRRIVISYSIDSGKTFNQLREFDDSQLMALGARLTPGAIFDLSQCLYEDRNGDVFVDLLLLEPDNSGKLSHLVLPLGVNTVIFGPRPAKTVEAAP